VIEIWQAAAGVAASVVIVTGGVVAAVRPLLRSEFVPRTQHSELEHRVAEVEKHLPGVPTGQDVRDLTTRLGRVETDVAVARTSIEGWGAGLNRVERMLGLLYQHQLSKGGEQQ